jgi:hypothetical protein
LRECKIYFEKGLAYLWVGKCVTMLQEGGGGTGQCAVKIIIINQLNKNQCCGTVKFFGKEKICDDISISKVYLLAHK